uniref:Secreted protein n=1 Tax=Branchiostoma floridae TaxID=7739 RepID=C3ZA42_BRAFL|eukprot:XP_002594619.1 hypothetical protein BRAFLDRAFT_77593 [Branchiostoma floridae]
MKMLTVLMVKSVVISTMNRVMMKMLMLLMVCLQCDKQSNEDVDGRDDGVIMMSRVLLKMLMMAETMDLPAETNQRETDSQPDPISRKSRGRAAGLPRRAVCRSGGQAGDLSRRVVCVLLSPHLSKLDPASTHHIPYSPGPPHITACLYENNNYG